MAPGQLEVVLPGRDGHPAQSSGHFGHNGTILGTSDGGTTWVRAVSGSGAALFGVSFTNADHGHAVGTFGTVLATADGGVTWTSQTSGTTRHLADVSFSDSRYGHAVGDDGTILATGADQGRRPAPRRQRPPSVG